MAACILPTLTPLHLCLHRQVRNEEDHPWPLSTEALQVGNDEAWKADHHSIWMPRLEGLGLHADVISSVVNPLSLSLSLTPTESLAFPSTQTIMTRVKNRYVESKGPFDRNQYILSVRYCELKPGYTFSSVVRAFYALWRKRTGLHLLVRNSFQPEVPVIQKPARAYCSWKAWHVARWAQMMPPQCPRYRMRMNRRRTYQIRRLVGIRNCYLRFGRRRRSQWCFARLLHTRML